MDIVITPDPIGGCIRVVIRRPVEMDGRGFDWSHIIVSVNLLVSVIAL